MLLPTLPFLLASSITSFQPRTSMRNLLPPTKQPQNATSFLFVTGGGRLQSPSFGYSREDEPQSERAGEDAYTRDGKLKLHRLWPIYESLLLAGRGRGQVGAAAAPNTPGIRRANDLDKNQGFLHFTSLSTGECSSPCQRRRPCQVECPDCTRRKC